MNIWYIPEHTALQLPGLFDLTVLKTRTNITESRACLPILLRIPEIQDPISARKLKTEHYLRIPSLLNQITRQ
jgi:hypothetical protein